MKINYGAFVLLPHDRITNHLHVMRQKASSAGHIIAHIPARFTFPEKNPLIQTVHGKSV
jgi:hypothetical protein